MTPVEARVRIAVVVLASTVAFGCFGPSTPNEPLHLKSITLGPSVDGDQKVGTPTRTFSPDATVYASFKTEGSGSATLHITWAGPGGTRLSEEDHAITAIGPAYVAFHLKPEGGWAPGVNRLSFALDNDQRHTAEFEIR